jgi:hypothetical protein
MGIKRIHRSRAEIRHDFHVTAVDGLPATDARTVKHPAFFQHFFTEVGNGNRKMLPGSKKINEFQIDHHSIICFC